MVFSLYIPQKECYNTLYFTKDVSPLKDFLTSERLKNFFSLKRLKNFLTPERLRKIIFIAAIVLCALIFIACALHLAEYFIESAKQKAQYNKLSDLVQHAQQDANNNGSNDNTDDDSQTPPSPFTTVINPMNKKSMDILKEYAPIYNLNPDVIGWIQIEGTRINYPVMQTPEWVNFYLTRDFNGEASKHGAIYANESADIKLPSDNVTIYGHRMKDGTMFAALHDYKKRSFFEDHRYITFDTIFEHHEYEILSVFVTTANQEDSFNYHEFVDGDEQTFGEFVAKCKELSLYDTGVDAVYGDKLITLSTCEHNIANGRLVVVAKRIS